jgi:hypothetical protein
VTVGKPEYVTNTSIKLSVIIQSDHHESYIIVTLIWLKWPKGIKKRSHLIPLIRYT